MCFRTQCLQIWQFYETQCGHAYSHIELFHVYLQVIWDNPQIEMLSLDEKSKFKKQPSGPERLKLNCASGMQPNDRHRDANLMIPMTTPRRLSRSSYLDKRKGGGEMNNQHGF